MTDGWNWEYEMQAVQSEIDDLEAEIQELRDYLDTLVRKIR